MTSYDKSIKMTLNELYSGALIWFNEQFGTAMEEFPIGKIAEGSSCVLANALKQNVNKDIDWNVGLESINPRITRPSVQVRHKYNGYYNTYTVPITIGGDCMTVEDKHWKAQPEEDFDYFMISIERAEEIPVPRHVTRFIEAFDWQMYPELTEANEIDWEASNTPDDIPTEDLFNTPRIHIIDPPTHPED